MKFLLNTHGPIPDRKIEMRFNTTASEGLTELSDNIAAGNSAGCNIIGGGLAIPQAKTIVVLGGEHSIFHVGTPGCIGPLVAVEFYGIEGV